MVPLVRGHLLKLINEKIVVAESLSRGGRQAGPTSWVIPKRLHPQFIGSSSVSPDI